MTADSELTDADGTTHGAQLVMDGSPDTWFGSNSTDAASWLEVELAPAAMPYYDEVVRLEVYNRCVRRAALRRWWRLPGCLLWLRLPGHPGPARAAHRAAAEQQRPGRRLSNKPPGRTTPLVAAPTPTARSQDACMDRILCYVVDMVSENNAALTSYPFYGAQAKKLYIVYYFRVGRCLPGWAALLAPAAGLDLQLHFACTLQLLQTFRSACSWVISPSIISSSPHRRCLHRPCSRHGRRPPPRLRPVPPRPGPLVRRRRARLCPTRPAPRRPRASSRGGLAAPGRPMAAAHVTRQHMPSEPPITPPTPTSLMTALRAATTT